MAEIKKFFPFILVFVFSITLLLTGCEFSFGERGEVQTISGMVTYQNVALSGVKIQNDFKVYATTNEDGFFTFQTRVASLTIYAKKSGYNFEPKHITVTDQQENYNFEASLAENLTGKLVLSQILISPNSITSITDNNYSYVINSTSHLKISEFVLKLNHEVVFHSMQATFIEKNHFTNIYHDEPKDELEITNGATNFVFEFQMKNYFKYNNNQNESVSVEQTKILNINSTLTSGDLNQDGVVKFVASGINSIHNGFTYDIQFVFQFTN